MSIAGVQNQSVDLAMNETHPESSSDRLDFDCEDFHQYHVGGFHPVAIRDRIHDRYEILHKLGFGGSATVWLAKDHEAARNVALKILTAEHTTQSGSRELSAYKYLQSKLPLDQQDLIVPLYDSFLIEGPNGTHLCLSLGLSGPSLTDIVGRDASMKIRPDVAQQLGLRVAEGLAEIHKTGITYTDFTPGNVLLQLNDSIATWSENELYERLGRPQTRALRSANQSDDSSTRHAPTQICAALKFADAHKLNMLKPAIKFIDFAEVRYIGEPEPDANHGLTLLYSDPETLFLRQKQVQAADVWSLACVLFELRASDTLIPPGWSGLEDVQNGIISCIGPLPEKLRDFLSEDSEIDGAERVVVNEDDVEEAPTTFEFNDSDFGDIGMFDDDAEPTDEHSEQTCVGGVFHFVWALVSRLKEVFCSLVRPRTGTGARESRPVHVIMYDGIPQTQKSLEDAVRSIGTWTQWCRMSVHERLSKLAAMREFCGDAEVETRREECDTGEPPPEALSVEEAQDFIELLAMMLTWRRDERASVEDVLRHRWFTTDYGFDTGAPWVQKYHPGYRYFVDGEQWV